jgi:hypothetical protein
VHERKIQKPQAFKLYSGSLEKSRQRFFSIRIQGREIRNARPEVIFAGI